MEAFWYTVVGAVVSAVISWIFARRASKELRQEAEKLRQETRAGRWEPREVRNNLVHVTHMVGEDRAQGSRELRCYLEAVISYLEVAGFRVERTADGKPSRIIRREITDPLGVSDATEETLTEEPGKEADDKQD
jgi:hypothetical protein